MSPAPSNLSDIFESHVKDPLSLHNEDFLKNVMFKHSGTGEVVVQKGSKERENKAAVLKIVGRVSNNDCFLSPFATWTQRTGRDFTSIEHSFSLDEPSHCVPFKTAHWKAAIKRLKTLLYLESNPDFRRQGVLLEGGHERDRIQLKHPTFSPKDPDATEDSDSDSGLPDVFTWAGWPVDGEAKDALDELHNKGTHDLIPLPAYDMDAELISPAQYKDVLMNAIVEAHFVLEHWRFAGEKKDVFKASIVKVYALTPPFKYTVESPIKGSARRRIGKSDPDSPTKRRRIATSEADGENSGSQTSPTTRS
ncbi:hypothetical protein VNI00_010273 [Paramarasmius palmivorus]|uniref:Uncharacterized protein n=1 Tax=Paramarasmius palmivorus TaxID=297713 RepID=A0AAW0CL31_9AGAR